MQYPFGLDSSSKKYNCPQCAQKSFVIYLDNETKAPVDEYQFGRCDRENSCGYHVHPQSDKDLAATKKDFVPTPDPVVTQIFPNQEQIDRIIKRTKTCISPLHSFLNKKLIPNEHLLKWGVYSDDEKTVYVFRNIHQQITNFKWFKYKDDGHRDKNFDSFSLKNPPTPPLTPGQKVFVDKYLLCLFGEHLLDPSKQKVVCVVESEKTAVIASWHYTQYDWVACGSNNGLTTAKAEVLKGRKVIWLSDADKASRMVWSKKNDGTYEIRPSSIRHLADAGIEYEIADLFPEKNDGYDIADEIMVGVLPEIKVTAKPAHPDEKAIAKVFNDDALQYDLPEGVDFEDVKWDIRKYMHIQHKGKILIVRKKRNGNSDFEQRGVGSYYCAPITNFEIKSLGLIASELDPTRLVEIKNIHGHSEVVKVPTKAFASNTEFTVFMESVGNFQYDGTAADLKKIRSKLYDTMLTFDEVENLGWHYTGYFLFANGAYNGKFTPIDKYGFVKLGQKNFFIQPLSCIIRENSEEWEDEKKFVYKEKGGIDLKTWANQFCKVHKENGMIAFAWYVSALFRDVIYQRFKFFPHCHLFGPPGTGKSQVGWSIRALGFVGLVKPFNLNTGTAVAFHREFSHFKNFPAWCDEYSNSIPFERIQALKAAYDGVGHKKSVKDSEKRTKSTQVNRAVLISGQELPIADNALFKRVILLQFHQTEYTSEEKQAFGDLQKMEEGGLTFITAGFMHFRKVFEEKYYDSFEEVLSDLMKEIGKQNFEVEDRIARNASIVLTSIKIIQDKIADHLPFDYQKLKMILVKNIKDQMSLISNSNETNLFWDTVMFLSRKGDIKEGEDYVFDQKKTQKITVGKSDQLREFDKVTDLVFIRFSKVIPMYREAFKRQNSNTAAPMDKGSLMHYLQYSKPFVGLVSNHNFKDSRTSCYCFDYSMLKSMGIYLVGDGAPPAGTVEGPGVITGPSGSGDDLPF